MELDIADLKQQETAGWVVPARIDARLGYLFSLVATWIGFAMFGFDRFGTAEWQDGKMSTYFDLSFAENVWILFAPLLIYSTVAMCLLLWDADRFSQLWVVRFGIYTGVILAIQFGVQVVLSGDLALGFVIGAVAFVPLIVGYIGARAAIGYLWRNRAEKRVQKMMLILILPLLVALYYSAAAILIRMLCVAVLACPIIAVLTSYRLWLFVEKEAVGQTVVKVLSFVGWGGLWGAAGVIAINRMLDLYIQLPDSPPDCYVATASANGHQRLVGAQTIVLADGRQVLISRQLQVLKAGELVLRQSAPQLHRAIRVVYDWIGPKMASRVRGPWLADIGFLFFKPFEWLTAYGLSRFMPDLFEKVDSIYVGD